LRGVLKAVHMRLYSRSRAVGSMRGRCRAALACLALACAPMLSGCIFSSERPDLALDVPPAYRAGRGTAAPPKLDWWRGFHSAELTGLIEEAQTRNLDIAIAIALIIEADAQSKLARAPLLPIATLNATDQH